VCFVVLHSSQDHLRIGMHDLDHPVSCWCKKHRHISTNIFIFLLKYKKQALGVVHFSYYICYYLHCNTNRTKSYWTWCWCRKYNNHELSIMRKPIHCIIWGFDFLPRPWPTKYPYLETATLVNSRKTVNSLWIILYHPKTCIINLVTWLSFLTCAIGLYRTTKDAS
jgi:hypothetical protein